MTTANDNLLDTAKKKRGSIILTVLALLLGIGSVGAATQLQVVEVKDIQAGLEVPEKTFCIAPIVTESVE